MTDFDWVTAHSEWTAEKAFEQLKAQLQEDVNKRQALRKGPPFYYGFKYRHSTNYASISVEGTAIQDHVSFRLTENTIEVSDKDRNVVLNAVPVITEDRQYRLSVNGQDLELWQVRKAVLEKLFFSER